MDHDILYETDICTWAEQQAAVLRGLASRGELPNELDLANVVEEIEDVGNSPLSAVSSFIRLILSHAVLIAADADADEVLHWTHEIATFRGNLMQVYQRSMRQRIDMESVWRRALEEAGFKLAAYHGADTAPEADRIVSRLNGDCPFVVEDLCGESFRFHELLSRLRSRLAPEGPVRSDVR